MAAITACISASSVTQVGLVRKTPVVQAPVLGKNNLTSHIYVHTYVKQLGFLTNLHILNDTVCNKMNCCDASAKPAWLFYSFKFEKLLIN